MPSAVSPNPRAGGAPPDALDNLLDYDAAVEDFMNDIPIHNTEQNATTTDNQTRDEDQEVQVKKKRQPIPKLDDNRLLSEAGIPKLRKITKSRLKFRGKGHEFTDISRLLSTYQLWLDDLYPRAKFRDALAMVEKVGHSKRMQVMRRAWLDSTKPNRIQSPDPELDADIQMSGANGSAEVGTLTGAAEREDSIFGEITTQQGSNAEVDSGHGAPDDDELDALLAESGSATAPLASSSNARRNGPFEDDEPDEDELDALLAESRPPEPTASATSLTTSSKPGPSEETPDEDELDALLEGHGFTTLPKAARVAATQASEDFADDEEAMASMGGW